MAIELSAARFWVAAFALALHNAEEVWRDLPAWADAHPATAAFNWSSDSGAFATIAGLIVFAVVGLALAAQFRPAPWMAPLLRALSIVMLLNAASHIGLSLYTGSLMPGVITAVFVLVPVFLWTLGMKKPRA